MTEIAHNLELQIKKLSTNVDILTQKILAQKKIISNLEDKNKELQKIIDSQVYNPIKNTSNAFNNKKLKFKLDKYIKVIDKCLIYLKNQI